MAKRLAGLLAPLLILFWLLAACGPVAGEAVTSARTEQTRPPAVELADYTIIRPDGAGKTELAAALLIRDTVNDSTSAGPTLSTDWPKSSGEGAKEILVGSTNRAESESAATALTRKDFSITFSGPKIIVAGGSPEATYSAAEYFCTNYISYESGRAVLAGGEEYVMKFDYPYAATDIKVASLNLLTASNPQVNKQAEREPRIVGFVESYLPDSLGVQECEVFWRMRLDKLLTGYARAQEITSVTKNYIYYRTDRLKIIDGGVFWLSETPDASSRGFGSKYYISCCWAIFESLETGSRYVHLNTHLDVDSADVRAKELGVLLPKVKEFIDAGYAVVLTGDFNSLENSEIYASVSASGLGNARYLAADASPMPTYNGFAGDVSGYTGPIDYCFVNGEASAAKYRVTDKYDGGFLSDHNALFVELTIYPR